MSLMANYWADAGHGVTLVTIGSVDNDYYLIVGRWRAQTRKILFLVCNPVGGSALYSGVSS